MSKYCPQCGFLIGDTDKFCQQCGAAQPELPVQSQNSAQPSMTESQKTWLHDAYNYVVGQGSEKYYVHRFENMNKTGKKKSWNWCAFLFGPYWMAYRKMYAAAALLLAVPFMLYTLLDMGAMMFGGEEAVAAMDIFTSIIALVLSIAVGMYGNWIYKRRVDQVISEYQKTSDQQRFMHSSDVTFIAPFVVIMCALFVVLLPVFIAGLFV